MFLNKAQYININTVSCLSEISESVA